MQGLVSNYRDNYSPIEYLDTKKMDVPQNSHIAANLMPHFSLVAFKSLM